MNGANVAIMPCRILLVSGTKTLCENILHALKRRELYSVQTVSIDADIVGVVRDGNPCVVMILCHTVSEEQCGKFLLLLSQEYCGLPIIAVGLNEEYHVNSGAIAGVIAADASKNTIDLVIQNAIKIVSLEKSLTQYKIDDLRLDCDFIGETQLAKHIRSIVKRASQSLCRAMITGGRGVGKSLVARLIHKMSAHTHNVMATLNPTGLTSDEIEAYLFNNDSDRSDLGILSKIHHGTLYLNEISNLPSSIQLIILQIINEKKCYNPFMRRTMYIDTRVIASSSVNPEEMVRLGVLREDLYHRLNVMPVRVPSLIERIEDIPVLCFHFVKYFNRIHNLPLIEFSIEAIALMQTYHWPGNVGQLRNVVERIMMQHFGEMRSSRIITPAMLSPELFVADNLYLTGIKDIMSLPIKFAREEFERRYLSAQVARFGGNISKTAQFVQMERSALHRKLKLLGVS